jgi:hypothetical protein
VINDHVWSRTNQNGDCVTKHGHRRDQHQAREEEGADGVGQGKARVFDDNSGQQHSQWLNQVAEHVHEGGPDVQVLVVFIAGGGWGGGRRRLKKPFLHHKKERERKDRALIQRSDGAILRCRLLRVVAQGQMLGMGMAMACTGGQVAAAAVQEDADQQVEEDTDARGQHHLLAGRGNIY